MRLTVVGCSGSIPGPQSASSCYLVEAEGFALVLDLGSGALGALHRHLHPSAVGTVLLSHLHADHCIDLTSLTVLLQHGPRRRAEPVPVLGPSTTAARVRELHGVRDEAKSRELDALLGFGVVPAEPWQVGPFRVSAHPVDHPVEAYAYRIEHGGRVLAYSGDCAPCPGLDAAAREADLALVEAAYVDGAHNDPGVHHTGGEAGALAERVGVRRLVVTHVPPWHDPEAAGAAARAVYRGPVEVARADASYEV